MAIVGPIVSFAIGIGCLAWVMTGIGAIEPGSAAEVQQMLAQLGPAETILLWLGWINIVLGVFNLVPGFPLDGGRVLRSIIWGVTGNHHHATRIASLMGQAFAWILIMIGFAMVLGASIPIFGQGFLSGLWLVLIGWFLNNAALMSYRNLLVIDALDNVSARRLMRLLPTRVAPHMTLHTLAERHIIASGQPLFPVEDEGHFMGWLTLDDVRETSPDSRRWRSVADAMQPAAKLPAVTPDQNAADAIDLMRRYDSDYIPVMEGDRLIGVLTKEDLAKWLSLRADREQRDWFVGRSEPHGSQ